MVRIRCTFNKIKMYQGKLRCRSGGQLMLTTLPMIRFRSSGPQKRLSLLLLRLSPMTKYSPGLRVNVCPSTAYLAMDDCGASIGSTIPTSTVHQGKRLLGARINEGLEIAGAVGALFGVVPEGEGSCVMRYSSNANRCRQPQRESERAPLSLVRGEAPKTRLSAGRGYGRRGRI